MKKYNILYLIALAMILLFPFKVDAKQITIKKINLDEIKLEVESSDTIEAVKEKIYQKDNTLLPQNQKLVFNNIELETGRTLDDYLVEENDIIYLFLSKVIVKYNLENLSVTTNNVTQDGNLGNNKYEVSLINDFTAKLEISNGYQLPSTINVKINNIVDNSKYTYNNLTGEIVISKDVIDGDIEIEAIGVEEYKVIFDANGGVFTNNQNTIVIDDIINFNYSTFEKPIRSGYKFIGFYTDKTAGKSFEEVMNSEAGIEEDTTFYARWEVKSENPVTSDGLITYIFMAMVSFIGLLATTTIWKKNNCN